MPSCSSCAAGALLSLLFFTMSPQTLLAADASKLPRLSGSTEIYASPDMVIYKAAGGVDDVAKAARSALEAEGWRSYVAVGQNPKAPPSLAQQFLKKDGQTLSVFTALAPAQGNAPTVQYTFQPIATDLPFPKAADGIEFDPGRPELITRTTTLLAETRDEMKAALAALGYAPVTAAEGSPAALTATPLSNQTYFVKTGAKPLLLVLATQESGQTLVHLRAVPEKDMLTGTQPKAEKAAIEAPASPAPEAKAKGSDEFDTMMNGILGKVKEATEKAIEGKPAEIDLDGLLGGLKAKQPTQAPAEEAAADAPEASEKSAPLEDVAALELDEENGLPFPKPYTEKIATKTGFRNEIKTTVSASLDRVLAFYRAQLGKKGWKEIADKSAVNPDKAFLVFETPDGPATLDMELTATGTSSNLILKLPKEAEARGLMPKPGKAMLVMSNAMEEPVSVSLSGKTYKLAPLAGTTDPNGPLVEVPSGTHKTSLKIGKKPPIEETIDVKPGEIWGLMFGEGGTLPLQLY